MYIHGAFKLHLVVRVYQCRFLDFTYIPRKSNIRRGKRQPQTVKIMFIWLVVDWFWIWALLVWRPDVPCVTFIIFNLSDLLSVWVCGPTTCNLRSVWYHTTCRDMTCLTWPACLDLCLIWSVNFLLFHTWLRHVWFVICLICDPSNLCPCLICDPSNLCPCLICDLSNLWPVRCLPGRTWDLSATCLIQCSVTT